MAKKRKRSIKEVQAAVAFVDGVVPRADIMNGIAPLWYGWALREAFLAGIDHERKRIKLLALARRKG